MERKKIIYVCRRFNTDRWGGTETVIIETAKQLMCRGYDVQIFTTKALCKTEEEYVDGIKVRRFNYSLPWFGLSPVAKGTMLRKGGNLMSFSLLWALLLEENVSLIHLHSTHRIGAIGRTVAKLNRIPYVVSLHGGWFSVPQSEMVIIKEPFNNKLEWGKIFGFFLGSRRVMKDATVIICVGKKEADAVENRLPYKRVEYLPNGVDLHRYTEVDGELFRGKYEIAPETKIILCISRIDYQKNQILLIKSFAEVCRENTNKLLVLIGSVTVPEYYKKINELITDLRIEKKVILIPGLDPHDPLLFSAFKACNVFVLPSLHEPFGIVILEAWAAQKAVIASNLGGIVGFTENGHDCILVEPDNKGELTTAISKVLSDLELTKKLATNGYRKANENFNWETITEKLITLYGLEGKS